MPLDLNTVFEKYDFINECDLLEIKSYLGKSYDYIYSLKMTICGQNLDLLFCIPIDWEMTLFHAYIVNYKEIELIPHLESDGKLCLYEFEGIIIDPSFYGLIDQTLKRIYSVIEDGFNRSNSDDFIKEFESYWMILPDAVECYSYVNPDSEERLIKYALRSQIDLKKIKENEKRKKTKKIKKKKVAIRYEAIHKYDKGFICSDDTKKFKIYSDGLTIKNGVQIHLKPEQIIIPPDWRRPLDIEYINDLFNLYEGDIQELYEIMAGKQDLFILFSIHQPGHDIIQVSLFIKNCTLSFTEGNIQIIDYNRLIPCVQKFCFRTHLQIRGGATTVLNQKKLLVIGCGSVGGYFIEQLIKTGFLDLTLIDNDKLKEENIYRHILGMEYVNEYKTYALKKYFDNNMPELNIKTREDDIFATISDGSIELSSFDIIISTTGSQIVNMNLNRYVIENDINVPVIYLWNEVFGIGSHAAIFNPMYEACYHCLIKRNELGELYDATSYGKPGQNYNKKFYGCASAFIPYGATTSIKTSLLGIEIILDYFNGSLGENYILSRQGDTREFIKQGFELSARFNPNNNEVERICGSKFKKTKCICSN